MNTNRLGKGKVIYPDLSYALTGVLFSAHNQLGRFEKEKRYGDVFEDGLKARKITYRREVSLGASGNRVDFLIEEKVVVELKAKRNFTQEDFRQIQNYLQESGIKLGFLVNFRDEYLAPKRIVRIDTDHMHKMV